MNFEQTIFNNLLFNEEYGRRVIAFLRPEYFHDQIDSTLFNLINDYTTKYNSFPSKEALAIDLSNRLGLTEDTVKRCADIISGFEVDPNTKLEWLYDETEKFCQDKALFNALSESVGVINDKNARVSRGSLPKLLSDALAVSFDTSIGTDFIEDSDKLYEHLHHKEILIPFDLDYFNRITGGGLSKKTLNVILAGTNVGKSMFMCHCAAGALSAGYNVLYITMEMSEEKIQKRIAANLYDIPLDELSIIPKVIFDKRVEKLKAKTNGKLIIKEYPTAGAGSGHFRHLLNELRLKKNFTPDVIYVDYLNICISTRIKMGSNINSYTYIKTIAEELRGLAVEFNVPIMTATQTTRSGFSNSDLGLEDTSESFGLPATADFMFALTTSEELEQLGQIMVKQLKARDHDKKIIKRFVIGVDYTKMRLYDVEQEAQNITDGPVMDRTDFGQKDHERVKPKSFDKKSFSGFK
ncbi:MAG: DnaB-like helicase C-terminal domain-containing protein [Candidatus Bathyarchaeia archaeon]